MKSQRWLGMGLGIGIGLCSAVQAEVTTPIAVNFETGQSQMNVDQELESRFADAAREMANFPYATMEVEGYADADGSETSNTSLSADRAAAIKRHLCEKYRIEPSRISVKALGETGAVATNTTEAGKELNRRAIVRIYRLQPVADKGPRNL